MSKIQALLFPIHEYTLETSMDWAIDHGHIPIKYHITSNYIRLRLRQPSPRKRYRTVNLTNNIKAIMTV